jgi:endonuclease/exonuclease/phosphatase family metal-dependent hydrolase
MIREWRGPSRFGSRRASPVHLVCGVIIVAGSAAGCAGTGVNAGATPARTPAASSPSAVDDPMSVRVMTFNIRYGTAPDGDDAWPRRRDQAVRVIKTFAPALLGLQEALRSQLDDIEAAMPELGEAGVGRDDGQRAGEYAAILYDRRRVTLLQQGTFWLSDTPEVPGSMTWGNRFPRVVTWGRFEERVRGETFYLFNTHWDHESQEARERGALLLMGRIATRAARRDPVLLTGDFNCGDANPAFKTLTQSFATVPDAAPLSDTFNAVHPSAEIVGTFHAFHGNSRGQKIDFVLASPEWQPIDAAIVRTSENGHYPSDHFPVTAIVKLVGPARVMMSSGRAGRVSSGKERIGRVFPGT